MVSNLKYFDGSVGEIDRVPNDLNGFYAVFVVSDNQPQLKSRAGEYSRYRRKPW